MSAGPQARRLSGDRLHMQHGPIDLIIGASGEAAAIERAYGAAFARFATILSELAVELPQLRRELRRDRPPFEGVIARRMAEAVAPFAAEGFVTPMAAVAGSVAEEVLGAMKDAAPLGRAYVNNGGDIALHLAEGERFRIGLVDRPDRPGLFGATEIGAGDGIAGIATSGWPGRSFSFGIAEAVTILAATASAADAAASIVANAVDLPGHPSIHRVPASAIQVDSDLGERLVTRDVGRLPRCDIECALQKGVARAEDLIRRGLIRAAALHCQGETRVAGLSGLAGPENSKMRRVG